MKTILAIWHSAGKGKTESVKELANLILHHSPSYKALIPLNIPINGDFRVVIKVGVKIICIESQGDPNTEFRKRLFELDSLYNPDLIICTTRTKGETCDAVGDLAKDKKYQVIWSSTYQIEDKSKHNLVNSLKAKHLFDLLINLRLL